MVKSQLPSLWSKALVSKITSTGQLWTAAYSDTYSWFGTLPKYCIRILAGSTIGL